MNAKKWTLQGLVLVIYLGGADGWAAKKDTPTKDTIWEKASRRGLIANTSQGDLLSAGSCGDDRRRSRRDNEDDDRRRSRRDNEDDDRRRSRRDNEDDNRRRSRRDNEDDNRRRSRRDNEEDGRMYRNERRRYSNQDDQDERNRLTERHTVEEPKEIGLAGPLLLNIFLPFAIGSWVSGDYIGGTIALTLQLVGGGLGAIFLGGLGALLGLAGWITGIIMVVLHVNNVNSRARRASRMQPNYRVPERRYDDHRERSFQNSVSVMNFTF